MNQAPRARPRTVEHYIGLMSGTSMDGVDGVVCGWGSEGDWRGVLGHVHAPFDADFVSDLLALQQSGPDELHRAALAANRLARLYGVVVARLLVESSLEAAAIQAIGAHGQTVRHQPLAHDGVGYTIQINAPSLLAELSGIDVVADFRSRDLAAGGQGAPLVPAFHAAVFAAPHERAVVNVGGIANLTLLRPGCAPLGWDVGPGNVLMDLWIRRHLGLPYDADGAWGTSGMVLPALLSELMTEPFLARTPPKSTGRDLFHADWLDARLACSDASQAAPVDVQATLCAFTAQCIATDLERHAPQVTDLLVCGGGAFNQALMRALGCLLPGVHVESTAASGLPPTQVESAAFAWLAREHMARRPASEPGVTGASGPRILGACYPGRP